MKAVFEKEITAKGSQAECESKFYLHNTKKTIKIKLFGITFIKKTITEREKETKFCGVTVRKETLLTDTNS